MMDSSSYQSKPSSSYPPTTRDTNATKSPSTPPRPDVRTASTAIPVVEPPGSCRGLKARANTSSERQSSPALTSLTNRRRARTNAQSQQPPLQLNLGSITNQSSLGEPLCTRAESIPDKPSEPIPIPLRKANIGPFSPTGTPLTARAPAGKYFSQLNGFTNTRPRISQSLTPSYSRGSTTAMPSSESGPNVQRGFAPKAPRPNSSHYTPTSPLSHTAPRRKLSPTRLQKERRSGPGLHLAGLPRFHPANFPSKDSNPVIPSPRIARSITSQPRPGRDSDAQQKLHQSQRELVANAGKYAKPHPPRLTPLRSPSEPMTPLNLEGHGDYLLAGSGSLSPQGDGREMLERLVRRENERRNHPEARSGSVSPALSPSVSPAVSPAGGRG